MEFDNEVTNADNWPIDHVYRLNSQRATVPDSFRTSSDKKHHTLSATYSPSIPNNRATKQIQKTKRYDKSGDEMAHDITAWVI